MACTYVDMNDIKNADAVIADIQTKFAKNSNLARTNFDIGNYFLNNANDPENALKVHAYNADHCTDQLESMWSQAAIVWYYVRHGENDKADAAYTKLLEVFKDQKTLAKEVFQIADIYTEVGNTDKAIELAQYAIVTWPESEYKLDAQKSILRAQLDSDNANEAEQSLDEIITDYKNDSSLAEKLFTFGEEYYNSGLKQLEKGEQKKAEKNLRKTLVVWEKIANTLPETMLFTKHARYFSGVCYRLKLNEPAKALEQYQIVAQKWPEYEHAWSAQTMIGACYRQMYNLGEISKEESDAGILNAYEAVMEKYPDCPMGQSVCLEMAKMNYENGKLDKAANNYIEFLDKYQESENWHKALVNLGKLYEEQQKPQMAIEIYELYLETVSLDDSFVKMMKSKIENMKKGVK